MTLIIDFVGYPGSGKSTLNSLFQEELNKQMEGLKQSMQNGQGKQLDEYGIKY